MGVREQNSSHEALGAGRRVSNRSLIFAGACLSLAWFGLGCRRGEQAPTEASASASVSASLEALSPELAAKVLAKVGEHTITLGDYAATLARMDQFERLRYQTPERRKKLLDEIINVELLAREAERRGLANKPEAEELMRELLRDELLRLEREKLPKLEEIPASEVREYYEAHHDEFCEPERRRVAQIIVAERTKAEILLKQARVASASEWGELVHASQGLAPESSADEVVGARPPLELAGDVGLVSAPGSDRGDNEKVAPGVRAAVFKLAQVGDVFPELVEHEGKFHIVRFVAKSDARDRSYAEAERLIRVKLLQERVARAEQALLAELKQTIPVQINQAAISSVEVPEAKP